MQHALRVEALSSWGSLSLLGGLLIVAASLFERNAGRLLRYLERVGEKPRA